VLAEIADLVADVLFVPGVLVITGIYYQYVALADIGALHQQFGLVEGIIADVLRDIHHHGRAGPLAHRHFAYRAPRAVKMYLSVHVGADMIGGRHYLAVSALSHMGAGYALEILELERHIAGPRGSMDTEGLGKVVHPGLLHEFNKVGRFHRESSMGFRRALADGRTL